MRKNWYNIFCIVFFICGYANAARQAVPLIRNRRRINGTGKSKYRKDAGVAQQVVQRIRNAQVVCSNQITSSKQKSLEPYGF